MIAEVDIIERIPTGIEGATKQDDFLMTRKAIETIEQIKQTNEVPEEYYLRLGTRPGGCSGMSYMLGFDSEVNENDRIIEANDLKMVIDDHSLFYLQGVTLDYTDGAQGAGFVFNNPNNDHVCGCGGGGH